MFLSRVGDMWRSRGINGKQKVILLSKEGDGDQEREAEVRLGIGGTVLSGKRRAKMKNRKQWRIFSR